MAVDELFGVNESAVVVATLTVLEITVPSVTDVLTRMTTENEADALIPNEGAEQLIEPVPPTAGVMHVQPAGTLIDLKVTPGRLSASDTFAAAAGPLSVSTIE